MVRNMIADARLEAHRYYQQSGRELTKDTEAITLNPRGVLVFTPDLVVLTKPVILREELLWGDLADDPTGADAWYVHLLVGNLKKARYMAAALPPLEWLCFQRGKRNNVPHVYHWAGILLKTH